MLKSLQLFKLVLLTLLFTGVSSWGQGSEPFTNMPASSGSYSTRTWTGNNSVGWSADDARTDGSITGRAITLRTSTLTNTTTISGGVGTLSFKYKREFTGNSVLKVYVNSVQYGGDITVSSATAATFTTNVNLTGNVVIEIENSGNRTTLDDLAWTAATPAGPTVTTTTGSYGPFCNTASNDITVSYTTGGTGSFTGTYAVQRSDAGGTFPNNATGNLLATVSASAGSVTATLSSGLAAGSYRVRVVNSTPATVSGNNNGSDIVISAPVAPSVTAGMATATAITAAVSGTATVTSCSGAVTAYGIEYSTTNNFADGTGTQVAGTNLAAGSFSVDIEGLSPATTYYYKAYATNATGTLYSTQSSFTTACAELQLPFTEGFDGLTFVPNCWASYRGTNNIGTNEDWERTTSNTYSGAGAAFVNYESVASEDWLVTPGLQIPTGNNLIELSFFERQTFTEEYGTQFSVRVSTTSQTSHASFTIVEAYNEEAFTTAYSQRKIDLTAYAGQTIYIAFVKIQDDGDDWYIDEVSVREKLPAPLATAATDVLNTSFVANWNDVPFADSYRLDVATTQNFIENVISENFVGFTANSGVNRANQLDTYLQTPGWTGSNVYDEVGYARIGVGASHGQITTPTIDLSNNDGNATLSFDHLRWTGENNARIQVYHAANGTNFVQVGSDIVPGEIFTTQTVEITGGTANSKIRIQTNTSFNDRRFYLDNVSVTYSTMLEGYNDLTVNGTSQEVTELEPATTYYYRVRAVGALGTSDNSNVIEVTTLDPYIWTEAGWSKAGTPTVADDVFIEADYATETDGLFAAKTIRHSAGTFVISEGTSITVENAVTNTLEAENFIIEDNANLLQINDVDNAGDFTVEKTGTPLYRLDYSIWSSPVAGQNLKAFSPGTVSTRFYTYNEPTNEYAPIDPEANNFAEGIGYLIRMPNGYPTTGDTAGYNDGATEVAFEGKFIGELNNGDVTVPLSLTAEADGYNAVGNPYPSPINLDAFYSANSGAIANGSAIYFWRKTNNPLATTYATLSNLGYNANDTDNADGGYDDEGAFDGVYTDYVINAGQGFIVQATAATNLVFTNGMRRAINNGQFFRTAQEEEAPEVSRFRINMTGTEGIFVQATVGYTNVTTNGLDYGWDGKALYSPESTAFYTIAEENNLSLHARAQFTVADEVAVGYQAVTAGSYSITLGAVDGLFTDQDIFIKDNLTGATHNLKESAYTFTTEAGTFNSRLQVVYQPEVLGTDNPVFDANSVIVYKTGGSIHINSGTATINGVTVYDVHGRKLYSSEGINSTETVLSNLQSQQQVLIVTIATNKGTVSKKVVY